MDGHEHERPTDAAALLARIGREADAASGPAAYLALRAPAYLSLYRQSRGNFAFAHVAAHGAVWASWYVPLASAVVVCLSFAWPDRRARLASYRRYVAAFKEINRRVAAETYAAFHLTRHVPSHPSVTERYPAPLIDAMTAMHDAARSGVPLPNDRRRALYEAYFRWEQTHVVGPLVDAAVAEFDDWPFMRWFCMRPWVWFSYFPVGRALRFRRFADAEERTRHGLTAYDWAERAGWPRANAALLRHPFYPRGRWCHLRDGLFERRPKRSSIRTDPNLSPRLA